MSTCGGHFVLFLELVYGIVVEKNDMKLHFGVNCAFNAPTNSLTLARCPANVVKCDVKGLTTASGLCFEVGRSGPRPC